MDVWTELSYETPLSFSPLYPLLLLSLTSQRYSPECSQRIKGEYDYIVVGGGSAGSVVAGRLSEKRCVSVLLLEAGPKPPLISEVPYLSYSLLGTNVDWKFWTVPQKHLALGNESKILWHAGRMLGGSGSFNAMLYLRGNRKDYDDWAAQGAKGWDYENVLPYFLKSEDNRNFDMIDNGYHQTGGQITVERPRFQSKVKDALHEAAKELEYEYVDINGAKNTGFYDYQSNIRNGQRCSSVKGYLVPGDHRPNLDILLNATVTKVIIENKKATGVLFYYKENFFAIKAKREVIVSCGVVNTPKLLMLSGIGPKDELEKLNIPVVADLLVGKNFQDHAASVIHFSTDLQYSMFNHFYDPSTIVEYINYRSGPLTNIGNVVLAFLNGLNANSADFPNYQIYITEYAKDNEKSSNSGTEVNIDKSGQGENRTIFTCASQQLRPRSRGTVTLRSADPLDPPVFNPNYLEEPKDIDDIVDGLKMCMKIINTVALRRLGAKPTDKLLPECKDVAYSEEKYFECYTKHKLFSLHHGVGTAKMGDPKDPSTVVDPELRVKGVRRLRVVDASIMPLVPSGNTNIPTIMVAEKASDIIKKSIKCFDRKKFCSTLKLRENFCGNSKMK